MKSRHVVRERTVLRAAAGLILALLLAPFLALISSGSASAVETLCMAKPDETACIAGTLRTEESPVADATTLGAAFLAGLATGVWGAIDDADDIWRPARVVPPGTALDRKAWTRAVERAAGWIPELSALDF